MKIVAVANEKGGVGKSAAAINLACQAMVEGATAIVVDLDPQKTAINWGLERGDGSNPGVYQADAVSIQDVISAHTGGGVAWCFLDMPGRSAAITGMGISVAHYVLIPTRPLAVDLMGSHDVVRACLRLKKPYCFLLSIAPPQPTSRRAAETMMELKKAGHPCCPVVIHQRLEVADAMAAGRGICEHKKGKAASEFAELFQWLDSAIN